MTRQAPAFVNFSRGEWGPESYARVDTDGYGQSARVCENFLPLVQGGITSRPGVKFIAPTLGGGDDYNRYLPWKITRTVQYMVVLADTSASPNVVVYDQNGDAGPTVSANSVALPWTTSELQELQFANRDGVLYITQGNHTWHTLRLDENGEALFEKSPEGLIGDLNTLVSPDQQELFYGAYFPENTTPTTLTFQDTSLPATLTSSTPIFEPCMASNPPMNNSGNPANGQWIRIRFEPKTSYAAWTAGESGIVAGNIRWAESTIVPGEINVYEAVTAGPATCGNLTPSVNRVGSEVFDGPGGTGVRWRWLSSNGYLHWQINQVIDPSVVSGKFLESLNWTETNLPTEFVTSGLPTWSFRSWSNCFGWPKCVGIYQQRLILGNTDTQRETLWGSAIGIFDDFDLGVAADDDAFEFELDGLETAPISYFITARRFNIGSQAAEYILQPAINSNAITPTSVQVTTDTRYGSQFQQAVQVGWSVVQVQLGRVSMRSLNYAEQNDGLSSTDLSVLANHISRKGLQRLTVTREPEQIIWTWEETDHELIGFTIEQDTQTVAWHRHPIANFANESAQSKVIEVESLLDPAGRFDRVWVIVRYDNNDGERTFIGQMVFDERQAFLDNYKKFTGPISQLTGLEHLNGTEVVVVVDDVVSAPFTLIADTYDLPVEAQEYAVIGHAYRPRFRTQEVEVPTATGTAQGKTMRVHNVTLRVINTGVGLYIGQAFDPQERMQQVLFRNDGDNFDQQVPFYNNDTEIVPLEWRQDGLNTIAVEQRLPLPCTIIGMFPQVEVYEER